MAMFENSEGLDREIERLTKKLSTLDPTGEDYKAVRVSLSTLYELRNAQYKTDVEDLEKRDKSEAELKQKTDELDLRRHELESAEKKAAEEAKLKAEELAIKKQELALAEKKLEAEKEQKEKDEAAHKYELEVVGREHRNDRIRDYAVSGFNAIVGVAKLAAVIGFSLIVADQGYKFEETGTPTSKTFREQAKNSWDLLKDQFRK